jgi:hypothetical protein
MNSKQKLPPIPDGWRILRTGEPIRENDLMLNIWTQKWVPSGAFIIDHLIGTPFHKDLGLTKFIRKKVKKQVTKKPAPELGVSMPEGFRQLEIGEAVLPTDFCWYFNQGPWVEVSDSDPTPNYKLNVTHHPHIRWLGFDKEDDIHVAQIAYEAMGHPIGWEWLRESDRNDWKAFAEEVIKAYLG